jgi:hypothetical protein
MNKRVQVKSEPFGVLTFPILKVTDEELHQVEDFVNARIQEQLPLIERRDICTGGRRRCWLFGEIRRPCP